jgi:hypothetical protein
MPLVAYRDRVDASNGINIDQLNPRGRACDTLAVTTAPQAGAMITLECVLCEGDVTLDSLAATSVDCPDCSTTVEFAADEPAIALAA